ncbi:MAG: hypothetical protein WAQ57_01820 [Candidatus Saccharimonadales bacterium]
MSTLFDPDLIVYERFEPVRAENSRGIFASTGRNFAGSTFGRDSAEVGEDLVEFDPVIPREVLLTLASLQGLGHDDLTEEEPGRIHHLYRAKDDMVTEENMLAYRIDSLRWGSDGKEMIYYGSVDATALFVRLGVRYARIHGEGILYERVTGRDGQERILADHLLMAADWLLAKIASSDLGLIEFKHTNPNGEHIQAWKDSLAAYTHTDGTPVNVDDAIAPLEVQGYAYDALKGIEALFPGSVPEGLAMGLARRTISNFWLEDEQMFAQAIDRDANAHPRPVRTPTSNSGLILDSDLLVDMPGTEHKVKTTIDMLMGPDFMTRAGLRCRSLAYAHLIEYPDYHGSYAVWFKETNDFIRGLEKHGRKAQANKLAQAIISTIQELGEYYEFVFVDEHGELIHPSAQNGRFADARSRVPEPGQAWTISAFVRCLRLSQLNS